MFSKHNHRTTGSVERRTAVRTTDFAGFQPRLPEREFGVGYGRSSGYVQRFSYVPAQPDFFRCR